MSATTTEKLLSSCFAPIRATPVPCFHAAPKSPELDYNLLVDSVIPRVSKKQRFPHDASAHSKMSEAEKKLKYEEEGFSTGRWTDEEHTRFLDGLKLYKNSERKWQMIGKLISTRSLAQIRSHAQKYYLKAKGEISLAAEDTITDTTNQKMESRLGKLPVLSKVSPVFVAGGKKAFESKAGALYQALGELFQHLAN